MIIIPKTPQYFRLVSIDNGSSTMGVSVIDIDVVEKKLHVIFSETIDADRSRAYKWITEVHGPRFARYRVLSDELTDILEEYDPDLVVVESPFMRKRFPEAFAVLREALLIIRQSVMGYSDQLRVELVSPTEAKMAVGANKFKNLETKEAARQAVLTLNDVIYSDGIIPTELDEHCIDSIAVAYHYMQLLLERAYGKG